MTLEVLRELIKKESKTSGNTEFDGVIDALVNEVLRDYTARGFYTELFVVQAEIALLQTLEQTPPSDIQHFLKDRIWFSRGTDTYYIRPLTRHGRSNLSGRPAYFLRAGASFQVFPYDSIVVGDKVLMDYYKYPEPLEAEDDFPIVSLENVVKKEVMARIVAFEDSKQYSKFKAEAAQSYVATKAQDAG